MAEIVFDKESSKKCLTLENCEAGDIILLNGKIYVIITESGCCCYDSPALLLDLSTGEQENFPHNTVCSRYQKALHFNRSDFQEYVE